MAFDLYTLIYSSIIITIVSLIISLIITFLHNKFSKNQDPVEQAINQVNKLLPQTQCAQCDYPGCIPYATAIIKDNAPINKCIPGGQDTVKSLSELLNTEADKGI